MASSVLLPARAPSGCRDRQSGRPGLRVLRTVLMRHIAADNAFKGAGDRKPASDYVRQLEVDQHLEVEGYEWSGKLWRDSFKLELPLNNGVDGASAWAKGRPVRAVKLDKTAAPLVKGSSLAYVLLNPDLSQLFVDNLNWITSHVSSGQRMQQ